LERVTLGSLAARLGLSKFAVSRALSGKSGVSEQTRRRVQELAAELGYTRQPAQKEAMTLGLVFHDTDLINSELHLLIQSGVQTEAQRRGYQVRMRWTHITDEVEAFVRGCSGAIMVGPHDRATYDRVYALHIPIVRTGWLEPLEQADFVGVLIPASPANAHFINRERLGWMQRHAWLINTARGMVVDERALYDALKENRIAGAALDVFDIEPYKPADPSKDLRTLPNVILTPHVGSHTPDANGRMASRALENIVLAEAGEFGRMDLLNPEVLARGSRA